MWADRSNSTSEGGVRKKLNVDTQHSSQGNIYQIRKRVDDKKFYKYADKEKLFMELQQYKMDNNQLKDENMKLKTRNQQNEKEIQRYEKICEEYQKLLASQKTPQVVSHELLIQQLKKNNKELNKQLKDKTTEIEHLKKNGKVTKFQELTYDRNIYFEESARLRTIIEESNEQYQVMQQKYEQSVVIENELSKQLKLNETLINENQQLNQKQAQSEDFIKQLQQLYSVNQQKCMVLEDSIKKLKENITKLTAEKQNLKTTIKQLEENRNQMLFSQSQTISKSSPPKKQVVHHTPLNHLIVDEMRYKLILRNIDYESLLSMLDGLRQQAREQQVSVRQEDLKHILSQEPFSFTDESKITQIVSSLQGDLIEAFQKCIGEYKGFANFPTFDFNVTQLKLKQDLLQNKRKIEDYWDKTMKNKNKGIHVNKTEVRKMLNTLNLNWDEPQQLYYFLNLFEKSEENLSRINYQDTLNPFVEQDEQPVSSNQQSQHVKRVEPQRISEESDEELFDKQSQDYSLDENTVKQQQENQEQDDDQQEVIFKDNGHIVNMQQDNPDQQEQQQQQQNTYDHQNEKQESNKLDIQKNNNDYDDNDYEQDDQQQEQEEEQQQDKLNKQEEQHDEKQEQEYQQEFENQNEQDNENEYENEAFV